MRYFFTIFIVLLCTSLFAQNNAAVGKETIRLFNGRNLDGWYTYLAQKGKNNDPDKVFSVEDGLIHICGEEMGGITTVEEYGNYTLDIEYKTGEKSFGGREGKGFDSGILIHSQGKDAVFGPWMNGIQACLIDGACGDLVIVVAKGKDAGFSMTSTVKPGSKDSKAFGMDFDPDGEPVTLTDHSRRINRIGRDPEWKDVARFRGKNEIESPAGEWNHMRIVAAGDTIEVFLNDKLVNRATNVKPTKGRIQIQAEAAEYFFRRIDLTPF